MNESSWLRAVDRPVCPAAADAASAQDPPRAFGNAARLGIKVRGLRKSFGDMVVLDSVDLDVEQGTVFALLGPNGAGKTTVVRILSTLLNPDGGAVRVGGFDPVREAGRVRSVIGVTGQFSAVDNLLTGAENLMLIAGLCHLERQAARRKADELLRRFDLADAATRTAATYSGGMRRRLDLAMTLVGEPRVIFLDEPTAGLDPRSRRTMWQIVRELADCGTTLFLTTQDLGEADRLAGRIAVLDRGRIVAEGTPGELKQRIPGAHARLYFADAGALERAAGVLTGSSRDNDALALRVPADGTPASLTALLASLDRHDLRPERITVQACDLDDVFLALTADPRQET